MKRLLDHNTVCRYYLYIFWNERPIICTDITELNHISKQFVISELQSKPRVLDINTPISLSKLYEDYYIMNKIEFVNIRLTSETKEHFIFWANENLDDREDIQITLLEAGYKFSLSYDSENACFISAMTGHSRIKVNASTCFTSRSQDAIEAVMMSLYKHIVLADNGDWSKVVTQDNNWG